jgi:hypothetical protein
MKSRQEDSKKNITIHDVASCSQGGPSSTVHVHYSSSQEPKKQLFLGCNLKCAVETTNNEDKCFVIA